MKTLEALKTEKKELTAKIEECHERAARMLNADNMTGWSYFSDTAVRLAKQRDELTEVIDSVS
jgi:hypothetical protein